MLFKTLKSAGPACLSVGLFGCVELGYSGKYVNA